MFIGDFAPAAMVDFEFTTTDNTGLPVTLAGSPVVSVYKTNSVTQSVAGVTLTVDFDSVTGLNHVRIDTSADGTFYAAGGTYRAVITTGTVAGVSVVGYVVGIFSLGVNAGQPWNYLTSAITTSGSIGKLLKDDIDVVLSSGIQARLPSALVSGRMDSSVGAVAANAIADAGLATDLDTYQAQIVLVKTALANHYTVIFYLNGQPITSGITSPTIQVIKASDGSDLVASTSLTQIASTQTWKYDDSVNLVVAGSAYVAKVQATIDGATRTWEQPVGASA